MNEKFYTLTIQVFVNDNEARAHAHEAGFKNVEQMLQSGVSSNLERLTFVQTVSVFPLAAATP